MQCKQASEMMSVRLDGHLASDEAALLDAHVSACSACQAEWRKLQALDRLLASVPMVQPPVRMRVQLMTRLERRERTRRVVFGGTTLALGTVALTLLVIAPILFGLLNATGIVPALIKGGPPTLAQLSGAGETVRNLCLTLSAQLLIPLAVLGLCGLVAALVLNGLWIGAVRRLRTQR